MDFVDIHGSGFVEGIPGEYANCRVYYQDGEVLHVGPLYQEWRRVQGVKPVHMAAQPIILPTGDVTPEEAQPAPVQTEQEVESDPEPSDAPSTVRSTTFSG